MRIQHSPDRGEFDVAQICENGHVVVAGIRGSPEFGRKFCEQCGGKTIIECPECSTALPGWFSGEAIMVHYDRPDFCGECGSPYPWTRTAVEEFKNLAGMVEGLSEDERAQLSASVDDLIRDTPRSQGAVARVKLFLPRVGAEIGTAMKNILVEVASESAKKALGIERGV